MSATVGTWNSKNDRTFAKRYRWSPSQARARHARQIAGAIREAYECNQSLAGALASLETLLAKLRADAESAGSRTPEERLALIAALVNTATEYMAMHDLRRALAGVVQALCKLSPESPQATRHIADFRAAFFFASARRAEKLRSCELELGTAKSYDPFGQDTPRRRPAQPTRAAVPRFRFGGRKRDIGLSVACESSVTGLTPQKRLATCGSCARLSRR